MRIKWDHTSKFLRMMLSTVKCMTNVFSSKYMIVAVMIAIIFTGISHSNCSTLPSWYFLKGSSSRAPCLIHGRTSFPVVHTRKQGVIVSHRQLVPTRPYQLSFLNTITPVSSGHLCNSLSFIPSPSTLLPERSFQRQIPSIHSCSQLSRAFYGFYREVGPKTRTVLLLSTSLHSSWPPSCPWRPSYM